MQGFQDNDQNWLKIDTVGYFGFIFRNVAWVIFVCDLYFNGKNKFFPCPVIGNQTIPARNPGLLSDNNYIFPNIYIKGTGPG